MHADLSQRAVQRACHLAFGDAQLGIVDRIQVIEHCLQIAGGRGRDLIQVSPHRFFVERIADRGVGFAVAKNGNERHRVVV